MKVTYIHHSSFLAELEQVVFLFDYFEGEIPEFDRKKPLVVFASHRHGDHFSPVIFELAQQYEKVFYVLSDDIWRKRVPENCLGRTVFLGPGEETELRLPGAAEPPVLSGSAEPPVLSGLTESPVLSGSAQMPESCQSVAVETLRSTDEGVAFLVRAEGKTIYHAGDLNHWVWEGESEEWNSRMREDYRREISRLAGRHIDVAFMLLDPRQEKDFWLGMDDFMRTIGADVVFPMHFWGDFEAAERFKAMDCAQEYKDKILEIHCKGQCFTVD